MLRRWRCSARLSLDRLLSVGDRQGPVLRARAVTAGKDDVGSAEYQRSPAQPEGEASPRRPLPRWQGPQACGSWTEGFEPCPMLLLRARSERWTACDLRFRLTEHVRSCPSGTSGFRCPTDPARTSATHPCQPTACAERGDGAWGRPDEPGGTFGGRIDRMPRRPLTGEPPLTS
jgi:hypothetical protein